MESFTTDKPDEHPGWSLTADGRFSFSIIHSNLSVYISIHPAHFTIEAKCAVGVAKFIYSVRASES